MKNRIVPCNATCEQRGFGYLGFRGERIQEIPGESLTETVAYLLERVPFLLRMDNIGLCEHRTPGGNNRHASPILGCKPAQCTAVRKTEATRLLIEKTPCARCTGGISPHSGVSTVGREENARKSLPADDKEGAQVRMKHACRGGKGNGGIHRCGIGNKTRTRRGNPDRFRRIDLELIEQRTEAITDFPAVRNIARLRNGSIGAEPHQRNRHRADIDAERRLVHFSFQVCTVSIDEIHRERNSMHRRALCAILPIAARILKEFK